MIGLLIGIPISIAFLVGIGTFPFIEECLFLLVCKRSKILGVKPEGVVVPQLFAILQGCQFCVRMMISLLVLLFILMLVILVFLDCSLFDSASVFISVTSIGVPSKNFCFQFSHGIKVCMA